MGRESRLGEVFLIVSGIYAPFPELFGVQSDSDDERVSVRFALPSTTPAQCL